MWHWLPKRRQLHRALFIAQLLGSIVALQGIVCLLYLIMQWRPWQTKTIIMRPKQSATARFIKVVSSADQVRHTAGKGSGSSADGKGNAPVTQAAAPTLENEAKPVAMQATPAPAVQPEAVPPVEQKPKIQPLVRGGKKGESNKKDKKVQRALPPVQIEPVKLNEFLTSVGKTKSPEVPPKQEQPVKQGVAALDRLLKTAQNNEKETQSSVGIMVQAVEEEALALQEEEALFAYADTIQAAWRPPLGVKPLHPCVVQIDFDQRGRIHSDIVESSGVASYDAAVRLALSNAAQIAGISNRQLRLFFGET